MNIVLLEPEIPANTGNIGRTCVLTGTALHLIRPLGFSTDDKSLQRAGLDYWPELKVFYYDNIMDFYQQNQKATVYMATTKATKNYSDIKFNPEDFIMFGKESAGIPEEILKEHPELCIRIPMLAGQRSLNLSNAAAVILYEGLRQNNFAGLQGEGQLHRSSW